MRALLFLTFILLAGCVPTDVDHDGVVRVACIGDSITAAGWSTCVDGDCSGPDRWCEYAATSCGHIGGLPTQFYNFGVGGAVAGTVYSQTELYGDPGLPGFGAYPSHADVVVELFGVNNIGLLGQTPSQVADAVAGVCQDVFNLHSRYCFGITLGPNVDPAYNAAGIAKAHALWGSFADSQIIDGTTDMFVYDGTHLDDLSERILAARVTAALGCSE